MARPDSYDPPDPISSGGSSTPSSSGGSSSSAGVASSVSSPGTGTEEIQILRQTADRAVNGPAYEVASNEAVFVSPAVNLADCYYSLNGPDQAKVGPRSRVKNTDNPKQVFVRNLSQIWVYSGTVGEGLSVSVNKVR